MNKTQKKLTFGEWLGAIVFVYCFAWGGLFFIETITESYNWDSRFHNRTSLLIAGAFAILTLWGGCVDGGKKPLPPKMKELEKLLALKEKGIITQEEFEAHKSQLFKK